MTELCHWELLTRGRVYALQIQCYRRISMCPVSTWLNYISNLPQDSCRRLRTIFLFFCSFSFAWFYFSLVVLLFKKLVRIFPFFLFHNLIFINTLDTDWIWRKSLLCNLCAIFCFSLQKKKCSNFLQMFIKLSAFSPSRKTEFFGIDNKKLKKKKEKEIEWCFVHSSHDTN